MGGLWTGPAIRWTELGCALAGIGHRPESESESEFVFFRSCPPVGHDAKVRNRGVGRHLALGLLTVAACTGHTQSNLSAPSPVETQAVTPSASLGLESFDACIGSVGGTCRDATTYLSGDRPHIVATLKPPGIANHAALWRSNGKGPWERIAVLAIHSDGHLSWQWETSSADVRRAPWRFKYTIPSVGASDVVRLNIVAPDF